MIGKKKEVLSRMIPITELHYGRMRRHAKKHMRSLVPYVDIMKISDEETKLLTDKEVRKKQQKFCSRKVLRSL